MEERMTKLEIQLAELLEMVNKEDHVQWLQQPLTKIIVLQLELNAVELMVGWARDNFSSGEKQEQAKGQVNFILEFIDIIKGLKSDD